jgi:Protein of unknown function (DUF3619)
MSEAPLSPEEIRAAAAAHAELGPEYSDAVVASFLDRVDKEITARVDARLAAARQPAVPAGQEDRRTLLKGIAVGISLSGIAIFMVGGNPVERMHRVVWVLLILAVVCAVAATRAGRPRKARRAARQRTPVAIPTNDQRTY